MKNNREKKKILFIIPYLLGGGALKTVSNLSKAFQDKYDVTVVGIYGSDQKFNFCGKLIELNMQHQKNIIKKFRDFLIVRKKIKKIKTENRFDYCISFLVIADFVNVLTKTKKREKTIISIRNIESVEYKNKWYRRLQIIISTKKSDHIVAISEEVKHDLIDNFKVKTEKITTIYNPCIIDQDSRAVIDKSLFNEGKTAITLGGLKQQKGQWHLIRAFSKVVAKMPDAKLIIFGRGQYEDYLKSLIHGLNLDDNVKLMGYIIGPYEYVKASDVFVFSSLYEGLGNALMEALKCGVPVISTDYASGAREILAPKTDYSKKTAEIDYAEYGILVPNFDGKHYDSKDPLTEKEEMMAEAIVRLLSDNDLKMKYRKSATKRAGDFDIEKIAGQWHTLLDNLGNRHGQ